MWSFLTKIIEFVSLVTVWIGLSSPTPTPIPIVELTPEPTPIIETEGIPIQTPILIPSPTPDIQEIVKQIQIKAEEILSATPFSTPSPEIIYIVQTPTPTPEPTSTPIPQSPLIEFIDVSFNYDLVKKSYREENYLAIRINTNYKSKIVLNYVIDDGTIQSEYDSGPKEHSRLSMIVRDYASNLSKVKTIVSDFKTEHLIRAPEFDEGWIFFSIEAENETGQKTQYAKYGNLWDWDNQFKLEFL